MPVDEETLFSEGDPILEAAIAYLDDATNIETKEEGAIAIGDEVTGEIAPATRIRYTLDVKEGDVINIYLEDESGELDTVLNLYDTGDNLLTANDDVESGDTVNSALEDLEIPADLTLVVEVATKNDEGEGAYTLRVVDAKSE